MNHAGMKAENAPASAHDPPLWGPRPAGLRGVQARLRGWAEAETGRLPLWTPVAIGFGAVVYFALKGEPPAAAGLFAAALAAGLWGLLPRWRRSAGAVFLIALGFVAADLRTALVAAPQLARELSPRAVTGRLVSVEESSSQRRLVIEASFIAGLSRQETPRLVRVNWRGEAFGVSPGDRITLRAGLSPPPPPAAPGAFDFARHLYFQQIGAVGFAVTAPERLAGEPRGLGDRWRGAVERVRLALSRRILAAAPGEGGAIVAAVVTGKRAAIPESAEEALQRSGLAHLLAISGLHMGLATGLIFFSLRFALAAVEPVALRYPIKKWAAGAALLAGLVYLLLSGGGWSARRACIMTSIVFIAILFDRRALSLRNVAVAAVIILLTTPEAVMHPGFQMSFAAATALIAAYEWGSKRADPDRSFSALARLRRYIVGIGITDTVAATATAAYGLYHFNYASIYSLPANLAAMPLMALLVMPAAVAGLLLAPVGLDGWAWAVSAAGVDAILAAASFVSGLPGAVEFMPQWPPAALGLLTLGGLWLCLQSAPWRLAGLASLPLAALMIAAAAPPSLFVSDAGDNAGVVIEGADGGAMLALFNPRKDRFAASVWKEHIGVDPLASETAGLAEAGRCDAQGCVARVDGAAVVVSTDPLGLAEDCARADIVVASYPVADRARRACKARLIDRRSVWEQGAHAAWIGEDGAIRLRTANEARGDRPWTGGRTGGR